MRFSMMLGSSRGEVILEESKGLAVGASALVDINEACVLVVLSVPSLGFRFFFFLGIWKLTSLVLDGLIS